MGACNVHGINNENSSKKYTVKILTWVRAVMKFLFKWIASYNASNTESLALKIKEQEQSLNGKKYIKYSFLKL